MNTIYTGQPNVCTRRIPLRALNYSALVGLLVLNMKLSSLPSPRCGVLSTSPEAQGL